MTAATDDMPPDGETSGGIEPDRPMLALLMAYQRRAWRRGERTPVEAYLAQQPGLRDDAEAVLDLIYQEIMLRERAGESPRLEEYTSRFPHLASQLALQFELERAFESNTLVPSAADVTLGNRASPGPASLPTVPGYEVLGVLGRGGMGVVYKVRQLRLNRVVALKMILAGDHAEPEAAIRFLAEAEAVARLNHPHIVQVFTCGDHDGRLYIEMECVDGGSLADRLDGTPRAAQDAAPLIETVARAIHEAHRLGIVHRDLKPANILLAPDGTPKVADFGLAKWVGVETGLTRTSWVVGSPSYMAPEQAEGKAGKVGPAADVYSLGAVLYELLTGRPPFKAATMLETLEQVKSAEPVSPTRLQPKLPRDLVTICLKCLEKDPARRYPSAAELAEDLRRFGAGEVIRARPAGAAQRAWRWCRRRPALAALGAAVALLLAVLAVGAPLAVVSMRHQRDLAVAAKKLADEKLWEASLAGARATRLVGQAGQRFESLKLLAQAAEIRPDPALRDEAIACLALADLRVVRQWPADPRPDVQAAFDPRLELYARGDDEGHVIVRRGADGAEVLRLTAADIPGFAAAIFSPDGRFLAATHFPPSRDGPHRHRVWALPRGELVLDLPTDRAGARLAFSPDGRWLAAGRLDHRLNLFDLSTLQEERCFERVPDLAHLAFQPAGKLLAVSGSDKRVVELRDVDTGAVVKALPHPRGRVYGLAWSGDGATLATGCDDHRIYLWDAATFRQRGEFTGHNAGVYLVAFHPSDNLLASASGDGTTRLWDPATGRTLVTAPGHAVQFSRDGTRLAFSHPPQDGIWEVAFGDAFRLLHPRWSATTPPGDGPPANVRAEIGPGGLLAAAGLEGVRVWDLASAHELAHLPLGFSGAALFHPRHDGLITYGASGLQHWPIRPGPDEAAGPIRLGPPRELDRSSRSPSSHAGLSGDGGLVVVGDRASGQAVVIDVGRPEVRWVLGGQPEINAVALSPDGRWVAAGGRLNAEVKVWERETGRSEALRADPLPGSENPCVAFSPDGRWLVTGGQDEYRFWETGTWRLQRTIRRERREEMPGLIAFAHDGRTMAITASQRVVRLIETATGRTLADLSAPDTQLIQGVTFGPDDGQLAVATDGRSVQVWDLRAIRRHLGTMRLDWDLPPLPLSRAGADGPIIAPVRMGSVELTPRSPFLAGVRPPRKEKTGIAFQIERRPAHETSPR
jgi:WD40 repeat protein/tRNA A-37 threonylcarbamoyl transferase component Bud32